MIYCDSSVLVALVTAEVHSAVADHWMRAQSSDSLCASAWVGTEIASALALKHRLEQLDDAGHAQALRATDGLLRAIGSVTIDVGHFVQAQTLVTTPPKGLRSGDALHLALVVDHNLGLATLDRNLADAAQHIGVLVETLLPA